MGWRGGASVKAAVSTPIVRGELDDVGYQRPGLRCVPGGFWRRRMLTDLAAARREAVAPVLR